MAAHVLDEQVCQAAAARLDAGDIGNQEVGVFLGQGRNNGVRVRHSGLPALELYFPSARDRPGNRALRANSITYREFIVGR